MRCSWVKKMLFLCLAAKEFSFEMYIFPTSLHNFRKNSVEKYLKMPAANPMYYNTSYKCTTITWKLTVVCTQKDTHKKFARGKLSCFNKPERTLYFSFCLANNIGSAKAYIPNWKGFRSHLRYISTNYKWGSICRSIHGSSHRGHQS